MFLIRWLLYITGLIPALLFFLPKRYFLRAKKKTGYKGPIIVALNHTSFLDYVCALLAFPFRRLYVLVSAKFYDFNPFLTLMVRSMGVIRVDSVSGNMDAVNKAIKLLKSGKSIMIFPEGHIETEGKLLEFGQAAALMSLGSGSPIVPVYHNGKIGPGKRDKMFIGELMFPDSYLIKEETLQEQSKSLTKDLYDTIEKYRQFYLDSFFEAEGKKPAKPKHANMTYRFIKLTAHPLVNILMHPKFVFENGMARGTLYRQKGMIQISNHSWWMDAPLMYYIFFKLSPQCIAASDVAKVNKMWGFFESKMGCIMLDRSGFDWGAIRNCVDCLKNDIPLVVFPEGHMNYDDKFLPFMSGAAMLALMTGSPVAPVYIHTTYKPFNRQVFVIGELIKFDRTYQMTDNNSVNLANELLYRKMNELRQIAIRESSPEFNQKVRVVRKQMKANLERANASNKDASEKKADKDTGGETKNDA
jgi:1-acyl-sn-glycerol-3-phosphate acyltransferase